MITKETLELQIEKYPDGSFQWYDILTKQRVEAYSPFSSVKSSAMSIIGRRFEMFTPISPRALECDGLSIDEVVSGLALNAANHPEFMGAWSDEGLRETMSESRVGEENHYQKDMAHGD